MTERSLDGPSKPLLPMPCCVVAGTRLHCFPVRKSLLRDSRQKTAPTKLTAVLSHSPTARSCLSAPRVMGKDRPSSSSSLRLGMGHGRGSMVHLLSIGTLNDHRRTFDHLQH